MNFKRFFTFLLLFSFTFLLVFNNFTNATSIDFIEDTKDLDSKITSPVALLMESETGTILYEKNIYDKMYPASTTKIMTAILALENCNLDDVATVSRNAVMSVPSDYTNANLQIGEELTIKDLLYAFLIPSANDCGYVLAEHIAGTVSNFANMMNEKAIEIGCLNTHFVNPSGIQDENHYSTAYDLALIGRYAMKNETFRQIVSTPTYNLPATNKYDSTDRRFVSTNFLIREGQPKYYYEYATGIKTGFTDDARDCVVASAKKDGIEYIAVILYAGYTEDTWLKEKFIDSVTLFNFAFDNYTTKSLGKQDKVFDKIKIPGATKDTKMLDIVLENNIDAFIGISKLNTNFQPTVILQEDLKAPISKGDVIGSVSYTVNDIVYSSNLIAGSNVEKSKFWSITFKVILIIFVLFVIIKLIRFHNYKKRRRKKNYRKTKILYR